MTPATTTSYRSQLRPGRDGFPQLLRAEWTKFRTVRGWVVGMLLATLATAVFVLLLGTNSKISCSGQGCQLAPVPVGPGGTAVSDTFYFMHQSLDGNGSITVRVTSLAEAAPGPGGPGSGYGVGLGAQPWAKAGVIVQASLRPGSPYAAVMATPGHGVQMQYDYVHAIAGSPGAVSPSSPRWLRLTRSGGTLTGQESSDGRHWSQVGVVRLAGLPTDVQAGFFVASPDTAQHGQSQVYTTSVAAFDHVSRRGDWSSGGAPAGGGPGGDWRGQVVGGSARQFGGVAGGVARTGGTFTVTGSGDIGPYVAPDKVAAGMLGSVVGLIVVIVVGALFVTAEYRRGLIRTTLAASPRRGRVLVAKAIVVGSVAFVVGLVATAVALPISERILRSNGYRPPTWPLVPAATDVRVIVGAGVLFAAIAVLALAVGALLRRSAGAVTVVVVALLVPQILALTLSQTAATWLLRLTPAAAFAIHETYPQYPRLRDACLPDSGCYPLAPWAGIGVLAAYAVVALGLAMFALRRRDA